MPARRFFAPLLCGLCCSTGRFELKKIRRSGLNSSMKTLVLFLCAMSVSFASWAGDAAPQFEMYGKRVGDARPWTYTFTVNGVSCTTLDELKRAVTKLPAGSKLTWETGCLMFFEVPMGPVPRMKMSDFTAFCAEHGVTFYDTHITGW